MSKPAFKSGWRRVKFGDVVRQVKTRVDPATAGIARYVAGEHMDTDDLRIRRWGEVGDGYLGPAFHMRFRPGQVLYGSRRTYLRKVAVADFEGICANTTYVLETKDPSVLLPELLPFIMQTKGFNDHSVKQSKGSVNPYINFSDLEWYEFALPPVEEQRRLAKLLMTVESVTTSLEEGQRKGQIAQDALLDRLMTAGTVPMQLDCTKTTHLGPVPKQWRVLPIQDALERIIDYRGKTPEKASSGIPLITAKNIRKGYIDPEPREYIAEETYNLRMTRGIPQPGDVFLTTEAPLGMVARVPEYKFSPGQRILTLRPKPDVLDSSYLFWLLMWSDSQRRIEQKSHGSTVVGIKQSVFREIPFRIPPFSEQQAIGRILDDMGSGVHEIHLRREKAIANRKLIIHGLVDS